MSPNLPGRRVDTTTGEEARFVPHRLRLSFGYSVTLLNRKRSGVDVAPNPLGERVIGNTLLLGVDYDLLAGVSFGTSLPLGFLSVRSAGNTTQITGLGDLDLWVRFDTKAFYPKRRWVPSFRLRLGASFPTGKSVTSVAGEASNQLTIGHGTYDLHLGLSILWQPKPRWALFGFLSWQRPLNEGRELTLGQQLSYGLGGSLSALEWLAFRLSIEAEHVFRSREPGEGTLLNSGGDTIYAVPAIDFHPARGLRISIDGRVPAYQFVHGTQLVPRFVISVGLSYRFASFARTR
ncbi:MAG: hypothetical protein KC609_25630 [Myxococcales bacterium]|nr:hypothetical protein [Myxococcales bacterium]